MREVCRSYGIDKVRTTAYKPSTNRAVERFHRSLNSMLGKLVSDSQRDWVERLPYVMAAYRASRHEATGFSSYLLVFGRDVRAPIDLIFSSPGDSAPINREDFVERWCVFIARRTPTCGDAWASRRSDVRMATTCVSDQHPLPSVPGSGITAPGGTSAVLPSGSGTIPGHFW